MMRLQMLRLAALLLLAAMGCSCFSSLQSAIDAAAPGAVVRVPPGVHVGALRIDKPLILEGAGWERSTLAPEGLDVLNKEAINKMIELRMRLIPSEAGRRRYAEQFVKRYGRPVLTIAADGVEIRNLKLTGNPKRGISLADTVVQVRGGRVLFRDCAVLGGPENGITMIYGSDVTVERSLVAALWGTGIDAGDQLYDRKTQTRSPEDPRSVKTRFTIRDSDLRNCHTISLTIPYPVEASVERCRLQGAGWFGLRSGAPALVSGCLFSGNARSGIYADGPTTMTVRNNLFYRNEGSGIACWTGNRDTIEGNTFARNLEAGIGIAGQASPRVRGNIFFGQPAAVRCSPVGNAARPEDKLPGAPLLDHNLFWHNEKNLACQGAGKATAPYTITTLPPGNLTADPQFTAPAARDFTLSAASPAQAAGIGAAAPLSFQSPWPLQPEERAIIPDGEMRGNELWKNHTESPSAQHRDEPMPPANLARLAVKSAGRPIPVALLYHEDPEVRKRAINMLAAGGGPAVLDDLIRAYGMEDYAPVLSAYEQALPALAGRSDVQGLWAWKRSLEGEAAAGRLRIDYQPINPQDLIRSQRKRIRPYALQLGPEHFDAMAAAMTTAPFDLGRLLDAHKYMMGNDHLPRVRAFLEGDWPGRRIAAGTIKDPWALAVLSGFVEEQARRTPDGGAAVWARFREWLDSSHPAVVLNALGMIVGSKHSSVRFNPPGVKDKVRALSEDSRPEIAAAAQAALTRLEEKATP